MPKVKYNFDINVIKDLIKQGHGRKFIASIYQCSLITISRFLKINNLKTNHSKRNQSKSLDDLTGLTFGRLKVLKLLDKRTKWGNRYYLCECQCGNQKEITGKDLRSGQTVSCGCYNKEKSTKHGMYKSRIFNIYRGIKDRCFNKNRPEYIYYGGKGITICEEWSDKENGFINFYKWAIENNYDDNLSIDRIDGNGNYCPENCRWVTHTEQMRNTSRCTYLSKDGKTQTIAEWSREIGTCQSAIKKRIEKFSIEKDIEEILSPLHSDRWGNKK
jgi:hypothetical protein